MVLVKKVLVVVGALLSAGLLVNSMVMTFYLQKIDRGLSENLRSIEALGELQQSVIEKNKELGEMTETVGKVERGMDGAISHTSMLLVLLGQVVDLNSQTLLLNRDMESVSRQSGSMMARVNSLVQRLGPQTEQMKRSLEHLKQLAESDAKRLESIRQSTEKMNRKIPGVM